ncbi:MAG: type II CRISPR RNA-guided endonuclease Cas9 [Rhodobacteraceae bacterium]|nr:type II CRISPR RNA-guided endonuclease Cas9 [Paracoccaceae bacterium]
MKIGWGIDVGVGSLGFAIIELDAQDRPARLIDGVALVYSAPTGGAERTRHKSIRTQNKRHANRIKALRGDLIRLFDLDPCFDNECAHPDLTDDVKSDGSPRKNTSRVRLRAHGLSEPLTSGDLARAILHIAKNRGQRLTRGLKDEIKADATQQKKNAKERQSMAKTANTTKDELRALGTKLKLDGAAHPSQLLMDKAGKTGTTRLKKNREGMPVFTRSMVEAELDALLKTQHSHHEALTDNVCKNLVAKVFEEAEPKKQSIGKCRYGVHDAYGDIETRLPRGSDLFQRKRIFEEVNNLRLISKRSEPDRPLNREQRDRLVSRLLDGKDLTAGEVRKELGLGRDALADMTSLDISRTGRKTAGRLQGHPLAAAMQRADALEEWRNFEEAMRERIAELVRTEDDVDVLHGQLRGLGLEAGVIKALSNARLPATYSAAGRTATSKLLAELKAHVISNHEAEKRAGFKQLDPSPPRCDRLPYYGKILQGWCVGGDGDPGSRDEARLGRIPNPVVHVSMNQLRKTANAYLRLYGKPTRICVELARDLNKSAEDREKTEREAAFNRKANERHVEALDAHKRKLKPEDLKRLRLHRMQDHECLYTGRPISTEQLFDGSVEIDHILPRADTGDDGMSNLALVFRDANQYKRKRPPFEAFGAGYLDQDYEHILARARKRGGRVYWRFKEDAMERYRDRDEFQSRFLNDTRYIARMATRYLSCVCTDPNGVVSLNGRITSALRHKWGLHTVIRNIMVEEGRLDISDIQSSEEGEALDEIRARRKRADKIRWDHRHHLLDAIVAACTTRSDVQRLQTLAARDAGDESASKILDQVRRADSDFRNAGICWRPDFWETAKAFLKDRRRDGAAGEQPVTSVVVKADHDPRGQLHEATNYGLICEVPGERDKYVARDHVSILDLTAEQIEELGVRDKLIRKVERAKEQGAQFWWGGQDPVSSLRNLAQDLEKMRARLLELMEEAPPEILEKASTDAGRKKARAEWAKKQYIADTGRRRFTRVQIVSLRILKGSLKHDKKPRQANPTGGNDRLVYFVNGKGDRDIEVVSTLDANTSGFQERWRREDGRLLFILRKNDLVEMLADPEKPDSPRRLYRTVSVSDIGSLDLEFVPVEEARSSRPPKHVRISSKTKFSKRAPVVVVCDPTGRVRWRGPRLN